MATRKTKPFSELARESAQAMRGESVALRETAESMRRAAEAFSRSAEALRREADATPNPNEAATRRYLADLKGQHVKALMDHAFIIDAEADSAETKAQIAEKRAELAGQSKSPRPTPSKGRAPDC